MTRKFRQKLTDKYRLVILNENTFEERLSFKLSRINVYVFGGIFSLLLIGLTYLLIAYTPLKEYVPGYSSTALKKQAVRLTYKLDSLENACLINDIKLRAMNAAIRGDEDIITYQNRVDSLLETNKKEVHRKLNASREDSLFRKEIAGKDRYNLHENITKNLGISLFAPLKGKITNAFDSQNEHFAVDIATPEGTPVKAVADGTVIFSEWSFETGFVIIIDHGNNLISVYKHNSQLFKHQGDFVKSGEAIAASGSGGEYSTGPHLHFELWYNGYPINSTQFIDFE